MDFIPIVLCAGFGTRLRPLTHYIPKPVVPVGKVPVAYHSIKQLLEAGADTVHCNTHFLPNIVEEELRAALEEDGYKQNRIRFWHEPEILETGGGIARIVHELRSENGQKWCGRDILAVAGDVFANPPLTAMMERWQNRSGDACALMTTRSLRFPRPDVTWVDITKNEVVGFGKDLTESAPHLETRVFSTHQIIRHDWVAQAPIVKESSRDIFYRAGLKKGLRILNVNFPDENTWFDIGDYTSLATCAATLGSPLREPVQCLTLSQADQAPHHKHLINTRLSTGVINRLRSSFALPSGESLASRVMTLVHQSNCLSKDETRLLTVAPGEPRLVLCAEACPVDLPFPLLLSLEDIEGSSPAESVQSSSTLFLFPTKNTSAVR